MHSYVSMFYFTATIMGGTLFKEPWRPQPESNMNRLDFVKSYHPHNSETNHLRILLHGPVGAGKSSFINSIDSVLQDRVTGRALTDGSSGKSFTKIYKTFKFQKYPGCSHSFVCNDIMGIEKSANSGVHLEDIKLALRGHVRDGYKFTPGCPMKDSDPSYNACPTLEDKVHVLVSVIPASSLSILPEEVLKKMRDVRQAASEMGIPQLAILTKVDEACPDAQENLKNVYKSKLLKQLVEQFRVSLGLPLNCIFLVMNYEKTTTIDKEINKLILQALEQIINYGEDFLNEQQP
ncbi:interferon-induced protein 44-like isoform X1 [Antennarius striatus]|uniref:interferon-induced protein 44-like isoform X1 n=2 Tax=Antennarius striatus TaxID=241820 RepID=UPI0035B26C68